MKYIKYIFIGIILLTSCVNESMDVDLKLDRSEINIGAEGGTVSVKLKSSKEWIASTGDPWISISPANGKGSIDCKIRIDSALAGSSRPGKVRIQEIGGEETVLNVTQKGFDYSITLDKSEVSIPQFAELTKRKFDVTVVSNVDFDVVLPEDSWLTCTKTELKLDKGLRPRGVKLTFDWKINVMPEIRNLNVSFVPKENVSLAQNDILKIIQDAAEKISPTRRGDSLALQGISRALNVWQPWDGSLPMDDWHGVVLWTEEDKAKLEELLKHPVENMDDYVGRVRSLSLSFLDTKEGLPYEIQYLTVAESIKITSNSNTFLKNIKTGPYLSKLTQLRRLSLMGYGLVALDESMTDLKNLEYLDLRSNNFQKVPEILTQENFPKLHALVMNANQRNVIYDLSNTRHTNYGGFSDENSIPERLLKWDNLDTLVLSVNYLHGSIPTMEGRVPYYTDADHQEYPDSLTMELVNLKVPKVLPNCKFLALNLNRLTGEVPKWILYHPCLDLWFPDTFIYSQEGTDANGKKAGFTNVPISLSNYGAGAPSYYDVFPYKERLITEEE